MQSSGILSLIFDDQIEAKLKHKNRKPKTAVSMTVGYISGVVNSAKGPEAGVWVIAETDDLPTKYRKIVVTDDRGRFLLPHLPKANYKIWIRGYGIDFDKNGLVWTALTGSNGLASFDRSKCKVLNGPTATGQHCPEGWTLYPVPGPTFKGTDVKADYFYYNWVGRFNTFGLGKNVPIIDGTGSESLIAFLPDTKKWIVIRVPIRLTSIRAVLKAASTTRNRMQRARALGRR